MPLIRGSGGPVTSIDAVRVIAAELIDQEQRAAYRSGRADDVSCRRGCTACCAQAVPVGPAELRAIVAAIDELDEDARVDTRRRIAVRAEDLRGLGFSSRDLQGRDGAERRAVSQRYFAAGIECPLLDGDTCVVRDARPLICRDYLVTSDPKHCESLDDEQTVRVRFGRNVVGAFGGLQRHIGDDESRILALALDEGIPESGPVPRESTAAYVRALTPATVAGNTNDA